MSGIGQSSSAFSLNPADPSARAQADTILAADPEHLFGLFGVEISTAVVSHAELMIFGGLIVWFLIVEPHGLAKLWSTAKQKLRVWPFPY